MLSAKAGAIITTATLAAPISWMKAENRRAMEIICAQGVRNLTFSTLNQASQIDLRLIRSGENIA
jgi:hypothetical protein